MRWINNGCDGPPPNNPTPSHSTLSIHGSPTGQRPRRIMRQRSIQTPHHGAGAPTYFRRVTVYAQGVSDFFSHDGFCDHLEPPLSRGPRASHHAISPATPRTGRPPRCCTSQGVCLSFLNICTGLTSPSAQHVQESDSAFEAKQRGSEKSSKKSGKSKGITKRYQKAPKIETMERRSPGMVAPSWCINTTPYGVPWTIGSAPVPGIIQTVETASDSTAHFHRWDSKDPSSSVRKYSPT